MPTPLPTEGSKYARDKTGIRSIQLVFIISGPTEDGGAEPWDELDNFKPAPPMGLVEVDRAATKLPDGDWALTVTFEGITSDKAEGAVLEYDNAGVEDPIESFPKFDALAEKWKARLIPGEDGQKEFKGWAFKIKDPDSGKLVVNPLFGTSHFLNNQPVLRVTFAVKEFKTDFLKNICKIVVPEVPEGTAKNIETPDGKSWLKRSVKASYRGNVWQITIEYALAVWTPDIYRPTS